MSTNPISDVSKRSFVWRLLVPQREVTLNLIFDNLRNYLLCGALLALTTWMAQLPTSKLAPFIVDPPWLFPTAHALSQFVFLVLSFLNLCQSWFLFSVLATLGASNTTENRRVGANRQESAIRRIISFIVTRLLLLAVVVGSGLGFGALLMIAVLFTVLHVPAP